MKFLNLQSIKTEVTYNKINNCLETNPELIGYFSISSYSILSVWKHKPHKAKHQSY